MTDTSQLPKRVIFSIVTSNCFCYSSERLASTWRACLSCRLVGTVNFCTAPAFYSCRLSSPGRVVRWSTGNVTHRVSPQGRTGGKIAWLCVRPVVWQSAELQVFLASTAGGPSFRSAATIGPLLEEKVASRSLDDFSDGACCGLLLTLLTEDASASLHPWPKQLRGEEVETVIALGGELFHQYAWWRTVFTLA